MDREFKKRFDWDRHEITPLDRLAYIGSRAMGALKYKPIYKHPDCKEEVDIALLSTSVDSVLEGKEVEILEQLLIQGGSTGGARPKVTIARSKTNLVCLSGFKTLKDDYSHWIVKFRSKNDPIDMGKIEYAYSKMAKISGVQMPETDLISVTKDGCTENYFAVERFDRYDQNKKRHILSLAGLLYANFRSPCMDYDGILSAIRGVTKDQMEVDRAFRLMVFNVLANNKDDHVKNFSFTYDSNQGWKLSPAYDLTFSTGMNGEHTTSVNGHGHPNIQHVLSIGKKHQVFAAKDIIKDVELAVKQWRNIALTCGVSSKSTTTIGKELSKTIQRFNCQSD